MAIFNAWCDRVPMLLLGATGPWDAARRRPWIDWIHTAADQGALVRDYTKWDDQPGSVPRRATKRCCARSQIAQTRAARPGLRQPRRRAAGSEARRAAAAARRRALRAAGAGSARLRMHVAECRAAAARRGEAPGDPDRPRVALGSRLDGARRARREAAARRSSPTSRSPPRFRPTIRCMPRRRRPSSRPKPSRLLRDADVVLSLDWVDLAGTLKQAWRQRADRRRSDPRLARCAPRARLEHGLLRACRRPTSTSCASPMSSWPLCSLRARVTPSARAMRLARSAASPATRASRRRASTWRRPQPLTRALADVVNDGHATASTSASRALPLGWNGAYRHFRHPLDYIGLDGGGGVGAGPGSPSARRSR